MVGMNDMVDRCMDAMGSMMGGMSGNGIILVVFLGIGVPGDSNKGLCTPVNRVETSTLMKAP
jgi:hypothetical protein